MKALLSKLLACVYPLTKAKLHRLVSIVGTLLTVAAMIAVWLVDKKFISATGALGADLGLLTIWASSWRSIVRPKADALIDGLDIPDGSTVTQTETVAATKTTTVTTGAVSTGVDRSEDITGVARHRLLPTKPPADPTGFTHPIVLVWLAAIGIALCVLLCWLTAAARAAEGPAPTTTPAVSTPRWKWGPSVAAAVGYVDAKTGDYVVGVNAIPLGACLGATYLPLDLGVDGCFNAQLAKTDPNRYFPSVMVHWRNWFNAGVGLLGQQNADHSGIFWHALVLVGGRLGFAGG